MKPRRGLGQVLIIVVLCILILYAGLYLPDEITGELQARIHHFLGERSEKELLTGCFYLASGDGEKRGSLSAWVNQCVMRWMPLGTYVEERAVTGTEIEDEETFEMILAKQAEDENAVDADGNLVADHTPQEPAKTVAPSVDTSMEKLKDYSYLIHNFYTIDGSTMIDESRLNANVLLSKNLKLNPNTGGPKVLIYHTHSQEAFADSVPGDAGTTIMGMGAYLSQLLNEKYGIETLHHEGVYDLMDGKLDRSKAYQMAEPQIQKILRENPGIEAVIDLHRDGVGKDTHLVTEIHGKQTAQIMFFNGLSRTRANGDIGYLSNPYIEDNLAFSLQMQIAAVQRYPGFARHIYLKSYRYNMHLMPKCLLVEAGAQTNTVEEMRNAMEILAETLDGVLAP